MGRQMLPLRAPMTDTDLRDDQAAPAVSNPPAQQDEDSKTTDAGKKWSLLLGAFIGWALLTWLIRLQNSWVGLPLLWSIFVGACAVGLFVDWRQTCSRAGNRSRKAATDQELNARALDEILAEESGIMDDAINYCILHVGCVALAFAVSWILWIFGTGFLSTSDVLWGADHPQVVYAVVHGDQVEHFEKAPFDNRGNWVGILRYGVFHLTGFEEPWFCCFLTGVAVTCAIGLMRVPIGFLDAVQEGHTVTAKSVVLGAKTLTGALHLAALGFSSVVAALGDLFGGLGMGGTSSIVALTGWPYLQRGVNMYQTPFRYALNLAYGGALFAFIFPVASHSVLGSIQNFETHEWGWLLWTLLLSYIIAIPFALYCQAAWYQGYGIGLWLGSWVPLRGWKLRKIYRTPASICLFHHSAVKAAVGLNNE